MGSIGHVHHSCGGAAPSQIAHDSHDDGLVPVQAVAEPQEQLGPIALRGSGDSAGLASSHSLEHDGDACPICHFLAQKVIGTGSVTVNSLGPPRDDAACLVIAKRLSDSAKNVLIRAPPSAA